MVPILAECIYIYWDILNQNAWHMSEKRICNFKNVSKLNYHLKKRIDIIWCTPFPKRRNSLLLLSFSEFFNTDAFCLKTNLTSHHEILTGKRQFDELSFKRSLVAERKLGPELWTITLTLPPMENALVDMYTSTGSKDNIKFYKKDLILSLEKPRHACIITLNNDTYYTCIYWHSMPWFT